MVGKTNAVGAALTMNKQLCFEYGSAYSPDLSGTLYDAVPNVTLTVAETGTYTVSWVALRPTNTLSAGTRLYIGGTAGSEQTTWDVNNLLGQVIKLTNVNLTKNQVITVYAKSGSHAQSSRITVANLCIEQTA